MAGADDGLSSWLVYRNWIGLLRCTCRAADPGKVKSRCDGLKRSIEAIIASLPLTMTRKVLSPWTVTRKRLLTARCMHRTTAVIPTDRDKLRFFPRWGVMSGNMFFHGAMWGSGLLFHKDRPWKKKFMNAQRVCAVLFASPEKQSGVSPKTSSAERGLEIFFGYNSKIQEKTWDVRQPSLWSLFPTDFERCFQVIYFTAPKSLFDWE